jgi:hypothetical protein
LVRVGIVDEDWEVVVNAGKLGRPDCVVEAPDVMYEAVEVVTESSRGKEPVVLTGDDCVAVLGGDGNTTVSMTVTVVSALGATKVVEKTVVVTVAVIVFREKTVVVMVTVVVTVTSARFSLPLVRLASPGTALGCGIAVRGAASFGVLTSGRTDDANDDTPRRGLAGTRLTRLKNEVAVVVDVCVCWIGSMTVMSSTLVTATTLVSAVPVYVVTVAMTVCVLVVAGLGRSSVVCLLSVNTLHRSPGDA